MFHVVSASAALQITSEYFLQAFLSCANDPVCSKSSFLLKVGIGKFLLSPANIKTKIAMTNPSSHYTSTFYKKLVYKKLLLGWPKLLRSFSAMLKKNSETKP